MKQLKVENSDYAEEDGQHLIGQFISDSCSDSWGNRGAMEEIGTEVTNVREAFGRLVQELAENGILSPRQVHYIAKGYKTAGTITYVEN